LSRLRFWDARLAAWSVSVLAGEVYVTDADEHITTVLGSCVSTCLRDRVTGAGGMNHLALPDGHGPARTVVSDNRRCLERLVGEVLRYGGRMEDLEIKVFGGGRVIAAKSDIGKINIAAVRAYFAAAGLTIAVEDVGGPVARRLRYHPRTGKAMIQRLTMRVPRPSEIP
jgi:chemotaxis protein CheD